MVNILLYSFGVELWPVEILRSLAWIFHRLESLLSFNSVYCWRYIIICCTWSFESLKAHNILHRYLSYQLHIPTIFHLQKVLVGSAVNIFFACDGILLYGEIGFIFIHMKLKLISLDISISSVTIGFHCIFSGDVYINLTCQILKWYQNHLLCKMMMLWLKRRMMILM